MQTLNGLQATAYCRIRYIGNDFQRAQRQRTVIAAVMEKAKKADIAKLNKVANGVMGNVATSLDLDEILERIPELKDYSIVANDGFPFEKYDGQLGLVQQYLFEYQRYLTKKGGSRSWN